MANIDPERLPKHIAIIMDGNGRWAKKRAMNRIRGHEAGTESVRDIVKASREIGISWLTLYAFSEENWKRPEHEINALMDLLQRFLKTELQEMLENGIRLQSIGKTEKIPNKTRQVLYETIRKTSSNKDMVLTLALSYGGRQELTDAVREISTMVESNQLNPRDVSEDTVQKALYTADQPDPELLIRTSGEYRISNFLLWQIAYAELYITPTLWPDFRREEYLAAIEDFQGRERRFGASFD